MAVQHNSPGMTVKGVRGCCMSNAVDGTDDMLWNGSEEDGDVTSERECEEDEGTDCEDGDSSMDWYRQIECDMLCVLSRIVFLSGILSLG